VAKKGVSIFLLSLIASSTINAKVSKDELKNHLKDIQVSYIKNIYLNNAYDPIWIKDNSLSPLGKELINQIKNDKTIAYDLPFYKLYKSVLKDINNKKFNTDLEIKLSNLYNQYMHYLIEGEIDWKEFMNYIQNLRKKYDYKVGYEIKKPPYSSAKILQNAILGETFGNIFSQVEPKRFRYHQLKEYLVKFLHMHWQKVGMIPTLRVGSSNPAIAKIRKRLKLEGDLQGCNQSIDSTIYDNCLAKAVKRFKIRHGLKPNSIIDRRTRLEFNRSPMYYVKKIRLNLDRIKWSNRKEEKVRIELNIPSFRLYLYDGNELVTTMRVVTGKPNHPTPVFSDIMTTIVVNPYWRIPESIVKKEMIKHLIKNPHYYDRQHKFLYDGWGPNAKKIDPATVNWAKYKDNKKHIPYHFMQEPGYNNALGKIKFLFPNKYSVYIHDTPSKQLFFRTKRAFSHGCMRIQKPRELLEALALYNSNINVDKVMKILGTNKRKVIALRKWIPVDITYFTAYVDSYGYLHFRDDVYGYDKAMLKSYGKYSKHKSKVKNSNKNKIKNKKVINSKKIHKDKNIIKDKNTIEDENIIEIGY